MVDRIILWFGVFMVLLNLGTFTWNVCMLRRWARLKRLLSELFDQAFMCQNAPIWRAWATTYGYRFRVDVVRRGGEEK